MTNKNYNIGEDEGSSANEYHLVEGNRLGSSEELREMRFLWPDFMKTYLPEHCK